MHPGSQALPHPVPGDQCRTTAGLRTLPECVLLSHVERSTNECDPPSHRQMDRCSGETRRRERKRSEPRERSEPSKRLASERCRGVRGAKPLGVIMIDDLWYK